MKKILSLILVCALLAVFSASCAEKPTPIKLNHLKVTAVHTNVTEKDLDKVTFVEGFNEAKVIGKASRDEFKGDVIVYTCTNSEVVSVFVVGENQFIASGTKIDTPYRFKSEKLYTLYKAIANKDN